MSEVSLLRDQLKQSQAFINMMLADLTLEQANWAPPGEANPIGATLAHIYEGEDLFVSDRLRGGTTVGADGQKFGLSEAPDSYLPGKWQDWARRVKVESLAELNAYGAEVFSATDEYLASLSDEDLSRVIDFPDARLGKWTLAWWISNRLLAHRVSHWGEISCLKGLQGGKGYVL